MRNLFLFVAILVAGLALVSPGQADGILSLNTTGLSCGSLCYVATPAVWPGFKSRLLAQRIVWALALAGTDEAKVDADCFPMALHPKCGDNQMF